MPRDSANFLSSSITVIGGGGAAYSNWRFGGSGTLLPLNALTEPAIPKPPGWNQNWELRGASSRPEGLTYWDLQGGEWRYHGIDQWHPYGHWDYNPWDTYSDAWRNVPISKGN